MKKESTKGIAIESFLLSALVAAITALWLMTASASAGTVVGSDLTRAPGSNDPTYQKCKSSEGDYWESHEDDCYYYNQDPYVVGCGPCTYIVGVIPGLQTNVPAAGVVAKGSVRTNGPRPVNLRVVRPQSGFAYQIIGESGTVNVGAGISEVKLPNVKVQPGDMVAISGESMDLGYNQDMPSFESRTPGSYAYVDSDPLTPVGSIVSFSGANKLEPLVNIYVEPDQDADGLPDESGDPDIDNDGLTNDAEAKWGTSSSDADSDDDGLRDGEEDKNSNGKIDKPVGLAAAGCGKKKGKKGKKSKKAASKKYKNFNKKLLAKFETRPNRKDSDNDGLSDGLESGRNASIPASGAIKGTDKKLKPDIDTSSVTNPSAKDTDGDGKVDGAEDKNKNGKRDKKKGETNGAKPECKKKK